MRACLAQLWVAMMVALSTGVTCLFEQKWRLLRWWGSLETPQREGAKLLAALIVLVVGALIWPSPDAFWQVSVLYLLLQVLYFVRGIAYGWFDEERRKYRQERQRREERLTWTYTRTGMAAEDERAQTQATRNRQVHIVDINSLRGG